MTLTAKILALHKALARAKLPHAFGGALALAWCTQRARGTIDIDVNVFIPVGDAERLAHAFPASVTWRKHDLETLKSDGQIRLWWDKTPIDLFLNTTAVHAGLAERIRWEKFAGHRIPFLSCTDLAIFKTFFNRTKDWADLEEMQAAKTLDTARIIATIAQHLGKDDERVLRLRRLEASM